MPSENYGRYGSHAKYGLPKKRVCLGCGKDIEDNGSYLWLRGFCSETCRQNYINHFKNEEY